MSTLSISLPRAVRRNPLAATGAVLVVMFVIFALFAPWIAPQDPAYIDLPTRLSSPSSGPGTRATRVPSVLGGAIRRPGGTIAPAT